jgi:hypothetical protein
VSGPLEGVFVGSGLVAATVKGHITSFMRLCPELRFRHANGRQGVKAFGNGRDAQQLMGAVDVLIYF